LKNLKYDLDRYFYLNSPASIFTKFKTIIMTQGIWAIIIYRMGAWLYASHLFFLIRKPLMFIMTILQKLVEIFCGITIPFSAKIGKGFYIGHYGGIILNKDAVLGENCNISQEVTIGQGGRGSSLGVPLIGNRVYIGPGAKIFGKIKIGNDVAVGANAVVTKSVEDFGVVGGIPAKIINYNGSSDFILYREKHKEKSM
jgi:serine O-acetyltransferase